MSILIDRIDSNDLFDDKDKNILKEIQKEAITAREKWKHEKFLPIYSKIKEKLLQKQDGVCYYCQIRQIDTTMRDWEIDHIVSIDEDDRHIFESRNLILTCDRCNNKKREEKVLRSKLKSTKYSLSPTNYKIVHARLDNYSTHIDKLALMYAGKTPKGRYTVHVCHLDRFKLEFITNLKSDERALTEGAMQLLMTQGPEKLIAFLCAIDTVNRQKQS